MGTPGEFPISELVARTGVPAASIHHYRRLGLLPAPRRAAANRFLYNQRHAEAVEQIRELRERHRLPLRHIAQIMNAENPDHTEVANLADSGEQLRDVAIQEFALRGYTEVSVADICAQAGVAKGTFYRYYRSKQDLFFRAVEAVVDNTAEDFAASVGGQVGLSRQELTRRLAETLLPGLPIMLEVAKRSVQGQVEHAAAAQRVFWRLAERLGEALSDDPRRHRLAGALIMDAIAHIFAESLMGRFADRPKFEDHEAANALTASD
ncbi:TetR family transcriptional regulator [Candidatus Poriferisocius sp.]|uniref:TetR family transcriptional regulator n=1 Tax=Candidatus Poriferisocius sp. TaxID=3101276 RepID=UPI003B0263EA